MIYRELIILVLAGMAYAKVTYMPEVKAMKHGTAFLHCNASGQDFSWSKSSIGTIKDKTGKYGIFSNGTLKVKNVTSLDVGQYKCSIAGTIRLTVLFKLLINSETIICNAKRNVNLICLAEVPINRKITTFYNFYVFRSNNQKILISENGKLTKQGKQFDQGILMATKNTLQIKATEKRIEGKFLCTAKWKGENHKGHSEYFFFVKVHGECSKLPSTHVKDDPRPKAEEPRNIHSRGKMEKDNWYLTALMAITVVALNFEIK